MLEIVVIIYKIFVVTILKCGVQGELTWLIGLHWFLNDTMFVFMFIYLIMMSVEISVDIVNFSIGDLLSIRDSQIFQTKLDLQSPLDTTLGLFMKL